MSGLFSPNFSVLNEPRYLRSMIRTTMRCLSACLPTATTFAGINVIMALSTPEHRERLKVCLCLNLYGSNYIQLARRITLVFENPSKLFFARTHEFLQYPFRTVALPFEYGK